MPEANTLAQLFWDSVRDHGEAPAQEWHEGGTWRTRSYAEFGRAVRANAYAMLAAGLRKGDRVAIWSRSSPAWAEVDLACQTAGFVTVPVYDTLTADKGAFILGDAGAKLLFVEDEGVMARVATVRGQLPGLERVVLLRGKMRGAETHAEFIAAGAELERKSPGRLDQAAANLEPDDLASLVYTSGTTGDPKGVMLTHGNFTSNANEVTRCVVFGPADTFLSFLPLAHVYERTAGHFAAYAAGARVCFARSLDTLVEDMGHAHPTIMTSVPRLYEKMHARITAAIAAEPWPKRKVFAWAMGVGRRAIPHRMAGTRMPGGLARQVALADRLVFHKLRERVGGRLRYFVSGGAALSRDIESFFWAAGIQILQGYGLTETSPVTNVNRPGGIRAGSVGRTIPHVECRIDASAWQGAAEGAPGEGRGGPAPQEGEICFKGPNVLQGYWRNDAATRAAFDAEGWFHSGDIGYLDQDGFLFITDRKKEIIVMSNGKKVAPQAIENALQLQPHIAQAMVVGDARNYIAALLVPDWAALERFALDSGIAPRDRPRLVADPRVRSLVEREVEAVNASLSRYEQVKKFWLVPQDWTVEGGELSPKMSLKRRVIEERFGESVQRLYADAHRQA